MNSEKVDFFVEKKNYSVGRYTFVLEISLAGVKIDQIVDNVV